jgi:hypothetical protein
MVNYTNIVGQLPTNGKAKTLVNDHTLPDIINYIIIYHNKHKKYYDDISEQFWDGDAYNTANLVFDFLRQNVTNITESDKKQTVKSPGRLLKDGHGDCKHYASFANGVFDSLRRKGYPIQSAYRFTADTPESEVHHVFSIVKDNGKEYWVDPVLNSFNKKPLFYNVKDIDMMQYLSGSSHGAEQYYNDYQPMDNGVGNLFSDIAHGMQVNFQNIKKEVKKQEHALDVNFQNAKKVVLQVGIAPARNAFLALLDLNAFNMAQKLHDLSPGEKNKLKDKWESLGGNYNKLMSAVNNGLAFKRNHPHLSGSTPMKTGLYIGGAYVGVEPTTTAGLLALASAIIAALSAFLKHSPQEQKAITDGIKDGGNNIFSGAATNIMNKGIVPPDEAGTMTQAGEQAVNDMRAKGATGTMDVHSSVAPDGTAVVRVNDVEHPLIKNAGVPRDNEGNIPGAAAAPGADNPAPPGENMLAKVERVAKEGWRDHKGAIIGIGLAVVVVSNKKIRRKIGL